MKIRRPIHEDKTTTTSKADMVDNKLLIKPYFLRGGSGIGGVVFDSQWYKDGWYHFF